MAESTPMVTDKKRKRIRVKSPRDAKGSHDLKILEKTTLSVFQSRLSPKTPENLKHCHMLFGARDIVRIDRQEWEERVGKILRLYEQHRHQKKNAIQHAMERINQLLEAAGIRETQLKNTTRELEQTGQYLRTLLDSMADIVFATDTAGIIGEANKAAQKLSGFLREDLIGRPFFEFTADPAIAAKGVETVLAQGDLFNYEMELIDKRSFKIPILVNATLLFDTENRVEGILINARDITELKKAQQAQARYAEQLSRANADLEEFASVASHDLQEPLKKVTAFAQNLARTYKDHFDEKATRNLNFMIRQTNYMQELVKNVLAYSRVDSGEMVVEQTECDTIFNQAMENLSGALEESNALVTHEPLPEVKGNPAQLVRVFQNIIGNALKYRDHEKEQCKVHISWERIEKSPVLLPEEAGKTGYLFSIRDNGKGIDPDFKDSIFDMFVRLDDETEGAGMGLAISRKIITRHGGTIWVESELDEWSVFYFTLPEQ